MTNVMIFVVFIATESIKKLILDKDYNSQETLPTFFEDLWVNGYIYPHDELPLLFPHKFNSLMEKLYRLFCIKKAP